MIVMDADGIVLLVSNACNRLFGYDPEKIVDHNVNKLVPSPYREEYDQYLARYHHTEEGRIIGSSELKTTPSNCVKPKLSFSAMKSSQCWLKSPEALRTKFAAHSMR